MPRTSASSVATIASPTDKGSYVSIYWVEQGHHDDHFVDFARPQVRWLYGNNRGFSERTHAHTVLFDHLGAVYRDADPVPVVDGDRAEGLGVVGRDRALQGEVAGQQPAAGDQQLAPLVEHALEHAAGDTELLVERLAGAALEGHLHRGERQQDEADQHGGEREEELRPQAAARPPAHR